ncbi:MAG: hypothetical protein QM679_10425 [Patulibacter sp.]
MSSRRHVLIPLAMLLAALAGSSAARADSTTVDFETGPAIGTPVNDDYADSAFVRFVDTDAGYRPYRRDAGSLARSGSVVADVGGDVCAPENPGGGSSCEFATSAMTARLTRTATSVTLYAGLFSTDEAPAPTGVAARMFGYDSNGNQVAASGAVALPDHSGTSLVSETAGSLSATARNSRLVSVIGPPHFTTPVTITSATANIASFRLEAVEAANPDVPGAYNAPLGFDDLTIDYPANSLPDSSISSTALTKVLAGLTTDVPVTITRLNGSSGPIALSAAGLPTGVTATFTPNPLPNTQTDVTMRLTADAGAPRLDNPADITITADPQNNANVGPAARTSHTLVTVGNPYELRAPADNTPSVSVGACGDTDVPFTIRRDITFTGSVQLQLGTLPSGVTATIEPDANVAPGGNLDATRTLRVHVEPGAALPGTVTIQGASGNLNRTLSLTLRRTASAQLADPSATAYTPRRFKPGTTVSLTGTGLCPGTKVQVGPGGGTVDATVAPDGSSLGFVTPRTATSGPVTVIPPASVNVGSFTTTDSLTVDNFRNSAGFAFHNPNYNYLSYGELTDAFGDDDMWITINPCWPFGSCRINTGIPDPLSYAEWGILNPVLRSSGGHCFGITRASWALRAGRFPYSRFAPGTNRPFDTSPASGPNSALGDWLDGQHALQASAEFLRAYAHRSRSVSTQVTTANQELSAGSDPIVTMHHDDGSTFGEGHAVLAYDMEQVADGTDIYVYDSNRQSSAAGDPGGTAASVIHITQGGHHWEMTQAGGELWSGGDDGSLFIASQSTIPQNPSLPSLSSLLDLPAMIFGSDGSAAVTATSSGAQPMPVIDDGTPGASGFVLGDGTARLATTITGQQGGTYDAAVSGPGFAGTFNDVPTKAGVVDQAGGSASGHALSFTSGDDRPLTITVATGGASGSGARAARAGGGTDASVEIQARASKGATESAGLSSGGVLDYTHGGKPASVALTFTTYSANTGPQVFQTGPVRLTTDETISSKLPQGAGSVLSLRIKAKGGKVRTVTVRNKAKAPAKLTVAGLKLPKGGAGTLHATANVSKLAGDGQSATNVLGVVVRVMRGKKTVARTTLSRTLAGNVTLPIDWKLPALKRGSYKVRLDARLTVGGTSGGSVTAKRSASLRVS